jgi:hypothetical protein
MRSREMLANWLLSVGVNPSCHLQS